MFGGVGGGALEDIGGSSGSISKKGTIGSFCIIYQCLQLSAHLAHMRARCTFFGHVHLICACSLPQYHSSILEDGIERSQCAKF